MFIGFFGYSQNTILDKNRKIIKLNIKTIDIDNFMKNKPKGLYYIQKRYKGRIKECKLINVKKEDIIKIQYV